MSEKEKIKDQEYRDLIISRLISRGAQSLDDSDLIAIILNSGTKDNSLEEITQTINDYCNGNLYNLSRLTVEELSNLGKIGIGRAVTMMAALELGRRRNIAQAMRYDTIKNNEDILNIFRPLLADLAHEEFWVVYLASSGRIIDKIKISTGGTESTIAEVKIIIKRALDRLASGLILIHNHPSGNENPSEEDKILTNKVLKAATLFDIKLLDHVIITYNQCFSFRAEGLL